MNFEIEFAFFDWVWPAMKKGLRRDPCRGSCRSATIFFVLIFLILIWHGCSHFHFLHFS